MKCYNGDQETPGGQADETIEDEGDVGALRRKERHNSSQADQYQVWSVTIYPQWMRPVSESY